MDGNQVLTHDVLDFSAFEPRLGLHVVFKTRTDALVADLCFRCGFSKDKVDMIFATILKPGFDLSELTLNSARDIDAQVRKYRQDLALQRNSKYLVQPTCTIPPLTIALLAEYLSRPVSQEIELDEEDGRFMPITVGHDEAKILQTMSLVHRSWTGVSQRALRSSLTLTPRQDDCSLYSPFVGPWLRRLDIVVDWVNREHNDFVTDAAHLIQLTPNLHQLTIYLTERHDSPGFRFNDEDEKPERVNFQPFLSSLQHVWSLRLLHVQSDVESIITGFLATLPWMDSLSTLILLQSVSSMLCSLGVSRRKSATDMG